MQWLPRGNSGVALERKRDEEGRDEPTDGQP
jgi:hypothetical protein